MTARRTFIVSLLLVLVMAAAPLGRTAAQGLNFGGTDDLPVEITADDGIEWQQENLLFVARGNAKAVRGEVTVYGDELRAYYRELPDGGTEIWRLDSIANVKIVSNTETAWGDQAVYNVDDQILVITGKKVRLEAGADTLTANRQIEYWEAKKMAVARGDALAIREGKRLWGEVLAAYFRPDEQGNDKVYRVDAFDDVRIKTETDTATGDRGVYNVETGIATLTGSVKLLRDKNVLRGCRAEVDLNAGISNLYSCPKGSGGGRVSGVLTPKNKGDKETDNKAGAKPAPTQ